MTFHDISMKMLIANFRRYRLYFLCNVFSVALFYSFAAILTNKSFMNVRIVDSMISSNIYAPSIFAGIFTVIFIPYSNSAFLRNRKYEYGVLMSLGMSEREVLVNMLLENCTVAGLSLISGLVLGTAISFVFYFIIQHVIGISALGWYFNADSYKLTAILYGVTIFLTLAAAVLGFLKTQLVDLMKERFRAEKKGKPMPAIFFVGVVFVIVSLLVMAAGYGTANMWLASLAIMFVGISMIITQSGSAEGFFDRVFPDYFRRHIAEISFVRHHHRSKSRISIIAAWMIGFSIFFAGLSAVMYPGLKHNAITYSPYDLAYSQIFGMNQVKDSEIEGLLNQNGVSVKTVNQVDYLRGRAFNLLPVSEVNKTFNCGYQIPEGSFITVFQYDMKDGYEHDISAPERFSFSCGDDTLELKSAGRDVRTLFNVNPTLADKTLILNDADYRKIALESREYWAGTMKLYSFEDWRVSGKGVAAVQKYLQNKNRVDQSEQYRYYRASSRIEAWTTAKQSAEFFIFLMFFIVVLFCGAADVMIHFKIKAESKEEQRMLSGLYRIGVTEEEMLRMIRHKNIYYFMPQVVTALLIGVFYDYGANAFYGYGWKAAGYSFLIGMILLVLQSVIVIRYSRRELLSLGI